MAAVNLSLPRHDETAMVTLQLPAKAVLDQPGRAIRTAEPVAALTAQRQRRIAAAIKKQQRLLATAKHATLEMTQMIDRFYEEIQELGGSRWDTSSLIARLDSSRG